MDGLVEPAQPRSAALAVRSPNKHGREKAAAKPDDGKRLRTSAPSGKENSENVAPPGVVPSTSAVPAPAPAPESERAMAKPVAEGPAEDEDGAAEAVPAPPGAPVDVQTDGWTCGECSAQYRDGEGDPRRAAEPYTCGCVGHFSRDGDGGAPASAPGAAADRLVAYARAPPDTKQQLEDWAQAQAEALHVSVGEAVIIQLSKAEAVDSNTRVLQFRGGTKLKDLIGEFRHCTTVAEVCGHSAAGEHLVLAVWCHLLFPKADVASIINEELMDGFNAAAGLAARIAFIVKLVNERRASDPSHAVADYAVQFILLKDGKETVLAPDDAEAHVRAGADLKLIIGECPRRFWDALHEILWFGATSKCADGKHSNQTAQNLEFLLTAFERSQVGAVGTQGCVVVKTNICQFGCGYYLGIEKKGGNIVASPHCLAPIHMVVVVRTILLKIIAFIMTPLYNAAIQYYGYCVSATIFFIQCDEIVGIMDAQLLDAALTVDSQLQKDTGHGCSLVFSDKLCLPTTRLFHGAYIGGAAVEETYGAGQPNSAKLPRSAEQLLRVQELVSKIRQRIDQRDAGGAEKSAIQSLEAYFEEAELQSWLDEPLSADCKNAAHRMVVKFHEALARTFKRETMEQRLEELAPLLEVLRAGGILHDEMMAKATPNLRLHGFTHIGSVRGGIASSKLQQEQRLSIGLGYQPFKFPKGERDSIESNDQLVSFLNAGDGLRYGEKVQVLDQVDGRWHDATIVSAAVPNCNAKPCEHCGQGHDGTLGSGRFCSRQCANGRPRKLEQGQATRIRLSKTAGASDWWSGASDMASEASEWSFTAVDPVAREEPTPMMPVEAPASSQPVRNGLLVKYDSYDAGMERWVPWDEVTQDHFGGPVVIRGRNSQLSLCANMLPPEVMAFMSAQSLFEKRDVLASVYIRLKSEMEQRGRDEQQRGQGEQQQKKHESETPEEKACNQIVSRLKKSKGTDVAINNALDATFELGKANLLADDAQPEAESAGAAEPAAGAEEEFVVPDEEEDIAKIFAENDGWSEGRHSLGALEPEMAELPGMGGELLSTKPLEDAVAQFRLDAIPEQAAAAPPAAAPEPADDDVERMRAPAAAPASQQQPSRAAFLKNRRIQFKVFSPQWRDGLVLGCTTGEKYRVELPSPAGATASVAILSLPEDKRGMTWRLATSLDVPPAPPSSATSAPSTGAPAGGKKRRRAAAVPPPPPPPATAFAGAAAEGAAAGAGAASSAAAPARKKRKLPAWMTAPLVFKGLVRDAKPDVLYLVKGKLRYKSGCGRKWRCEHRKQPSHCDKCNPGSATAKQYQDADKRSRDLKGQLAKQLAQLAPGQTYDTDGNVCAGGILPSKIGKGALRKAIIDLNHTPCV
eukprot:COSAG04_NODE_2_length_56781_cov_25.092252_11_plen_1368_part_00